jgi:hypothetical protein
MASLQAEVERLRAERATDADETAGMLVQIAESERMKAAAQSHAAEAEGRADVLRADLDQAHTRIDELEAEVEGLRRSWAASEQQLSAVRGSMETALALLEDMERREEMAASLRARGMRDALQTLARSAREPADAKPPSSGPEAPILESRVEIIGGDADFDIDLAESE